MTEADFNRLEWVSMPHQKRTNRACGRFVASIPQTNLAVTMTVYKVANRGRKGGYACISRYHFRGHGFTGIRPLLVAINEYLLRQRGDGTE